MAGGDVLCVANIGRRERRQRLVAGIVLLALSLAAAAGFALQRSPAPARAVLALPLFLSFLALFQAAAGT